jgi:hypothetical protein
LSCGKISDLFPVGLLDIGGSVSTLFHGDTSYVTVGESRVLITSAYPLLCLEGPRFVSLLYPL